MIRKIRQQLRSLILKLPLGLKWGVQQTDSFQFSSCSPLSKVGTLANARNGHGAIFDGVKFLIIGGTTYNDQVTNEICTLVDSVVSCVEQSIALKDYKYYPELFLVAEDFGKDVTKC